MTGLQAVLSFPSSTCDRSGLSLFVIIVPIKRQFWNILMWEKPTYALCCLLCIPLCISDCIPIMVYYGILWSRPRVRTRMSVSRAHAHAGLARARALIARLFFLAQVNENDVSAAARLRTLCGSPAHAVAGLGPCRCKAPFSSKIEAVAQFDGSLLL